MCLLCGEVREFKNFIEASSWADDKPVFRSYAGGPSAVARSLADYLERADTDHE
jgi:hypothetical protein